VIAFQTRLGAYAFGRGGGGFERDFWAVANGSLGNRSFDRAANFWGWAIAQLCRQVLKVDRLG